MLLLGPISIIVVDVYADVTVYKQLNYIGPVSYFILQKTLSKFQLYKHFQKKGNNKIYFSSASRLIRLPE